MLATINTFSDHLFSDIPDTKSFQGLTGKRLNPVQSGELSPNFTLIKERGIWQHSLFQTLSDHTFSVKQLLDKPLVIAFYSVHWKNHAEELLRTLKTAQQEINAYGGHLLLISCEDTRALQQYANRLSFNIYHDKYNSIAEKFGVYSEENPVWNRFSGIDINIPLLSAYVISPSGQIVYDHVERDFLIPFSSKDLLAAVKGASKYSS